MIVLKFSAVEVDEEFDDRKGVVECKKIKDGINICERITITDKISALINIGQILKMFQDMKAEVKRNGQ